MLLSAVAGLRRQSGRDAGRSGARGAGARTFGRTALHGLPEPVDRRFQCRSRQGSAPAGARAHRPRATATTQVLDYSSSRYGEFVLLKPRLSAKTCCSGARRSSCCWRVGRGDRFRATRRQTDRHALHDEQARPSARTELVGKQAGATTFLGHARRSVRDRLNDARQHYQIFMVRTVRSKVRPSYISLIN